MDNFSNETLGRLALDPARKYSANEYAHAGRRIREMLADAEPVREPTEPGHVKVKVQISGTAFNAFARCTVIGCGHIAGVDAVMRGDVIVDVPVRRATHIFGEA